jgi:hypothetical protein
MKLKFGDLIGKQAVVNKIKAERLRKKQLDQAAQYLRKMPVLPNPGCANWYYPLSIRSLPLDVLTEANCIEHKRRGLVDPLPVHAGEQQKQADD